MELAAAGFVNNVFNFVIYFMLGISYASTPVIGASYSQKDYKAVAQSLVDSIVVNFLFSLVIVALRLLLYHNIGILQQPEEIMPYALPYFLLIKLSCCLQGVIFWYISTSSIWCTTASEAMKMVAWLVPGVPLNQ